MANALSNINTFSTHPVLKLMTSQLFQNGTLGVRPHGGTYQCRDQNVRLMFYKEMYSIRNVTVSIRPELQLVIHKYQAQ